MSILAASIASIVLASSDICADPIPGGIGEPPFCVFSEPTLIQTPYFSFEAQPEILVGVDRGGERVVIEGSIRQSPVGLRIFAHPLDQQDAIMRQFGHCGTLSAKSDSELICDQSDEDFVQIRKLLIGAKGVVVAELSAGQIAFAQLPVYKKMLESVSAE